MLTTLQGAPSLRGELELGRPAYYRNPCELGRPSSGAVGLSGAALGPPVLNRRCCRLVSDQLWMAIGKTSRRFNVGYGVPWRPSPRPRANRDWLDLHEASSSARRVRARSSSPR